MRLTLRSTGREHPNQLGLVDMFSVMHIIQSGGLVLLGIVLFAEVGLFLGFFLPGDTLLIAAGIYAKEGKLSIAGLLVVSAFAAAAGDNLSYFIGRTLGPKVFRNEDSVIFQPHHVKRAEKFYEKYGPKTLLISHFLPVIRTFTPLLAGVAHMQYRKFVLFNAIGDTLWGVAVSLLGYYVGSRIPNIDSYIQLAVAFVIAATLLPTIYQFIRLHLRRTARNKAARLQKEDSSEPQSTPKVRTKK